MSNSVSIFFNTPFNRLPSASTDVGLIDEDFKVQQHLKDSCDIDKIVKKYKKTGIVTHFHNKSPLDGDFTNAHDFQSSMERVVAAQTSFEALPSSVRSRFANDPANLLAFVSDEANREEAIKLGLLPNVQNLDTTVPEKKSSAAQKDDGEAVQKL